MPVGLLRPSLQTKHDTLSGSMVATVQYFSMACPNATTASSDVASLNSLVCHAPGCVLKTGYNVQAAKVRIIHEVSPYATWDQNASARSVSASAFWIWQSTEPPTRSPRGSEPAVLTLCGRAGIRHRKTLPKAPLRAAESHLSGLTAEELVPFLICPLRSVRLGSQTLCRLFP